MRALLTQPALAIDDGSIEAAIKASPTTLIGSRVTSSIDDELYDLN